MSAPQEILKKYWGYDKFRPLQEEIINAALDNRDVLALLPTGGGKSVCFQIPAILNKGLCIVVSPLISLMKDQVDQLKKRGIAAEVVFSGMNHREIDIVLDQCIYGKIKFLYVSPERLKTEILRTRLLSMDVSLLVIDEAHCISQWGYDFRPSYTEIARFRKLIPTTNIIALTATATEEVKKDITEKLDLKNHAFFKKSFIRENLAYIVQPSEDKLGRLLYILNKVPGSAIVYANTRKKTKEIATYLEQNKISTIYYNAGLNSLEREKRQDLWMKDQIRVIVATNSFGMGIDKPNVRLVVHIDLPTTLEAYYQEAGRAGRDEQKAYSILLYEKNDANNLRENLEVTNPTLDQIKIIYQNLANYYSVAIGSHNMVTYDFNIQDFSEKYNLKSNVVYHILKILEQQSIIQVNETFFERSKINIDLNTKELYAFQVANSQYDLLIKAILRIYGGEVFGSFISIYEERIAKLINSTKEKITAKLHQLHKLGIINYTPQKDKPQLTFLKERSPINDIPIDMKLLKARQLVATQKCEAIITYATHKYRCRQQILMEYFEEISYVFCNKCDICLAMKKRKSIQTDYEKYKEIIQEELKKSPQTISYLIEFLKTEVEQDAIDIIQTMLYFEDISCDSSGFLIIIEK